MAKGLQDLMKGEPYALLFKIRIGAAGPYVDWTTTEAYLFFVSDGRTDYRKKLVWVPGGPSNDGAAETIGGISHVAFRLSAEWTRDDANLPVENEQESYTVYFHKGPLTGTSGFGKNLGSVNVLLLPDDEPVEP